MPYVLMLTSAIAGIVSSSFMKQYDKKHASGRFIYLAILCFFASLFFAVTNKNGFSFEPKIIFYGLLSGAFYCSAYFFTFVAYSSGSFVLTNLVISFSLISSVIYGLIFLNDSLSVFGYIGLVLIFVSMILINIAKGGDGIGKKGISLKWLLAALACFIGNSVISIVKKVQQLEFNKAHDNEYAIYMIFSSFIVFLIISLIKEKDEWRHFFSPGRLYAVGSGLCNGLQNFLSLLVNSMMILSIAGPLTTGITILLNFFVSLILFKEKFSKLQVAGVILGAVSVVMLSLR